MRYCGETLKKLFVSLPKPTEGYGYMPSSAPLQTQAAPMQMFGPTSASSPITTYGGAAAPVTMDPFMQWLQRQGYGGQ